MKKAATSREWLLLIYRVPSEPSTHRVQIWRKIRNLGGLFLQHSVCILPATPRHERELRKLEHEIAREDGGQAHLFLSVTLGRAEALEALFNGERDDEYEEIIQRCREFLVEIEQETRKKHFSFAELEENEVDLAKLENWFSKVRQRDFFGASKLAEAESLLQQCHDRLTGFSERVFRWTDRNAFDAPATPPVKPKRRRPGGGR